MRHSAEVAEIFEACASRAKLQLRLDDICGEFWDGVLAGTVIAKTPLEKKLAEFATNTLITLEEEREEAAREKALEYEPSAEWER